MLIKTQRIVNLRIRFCHKYLQILKENDRKFVYLDEIWVYQNDNQVGQWLLESN
jgi:phosphatidylglycerophosphatase A